MTTYERSIRTATSLVIAALFAAAAHFWPVETFAVMGYFALGKMK